MSKIGLWPDIHRRAMQASKELEHEIRVGDWRFAEEHEIEKFTDANNKMMTFIMRWRKAMEIVSPLVEIVASFGVAGALVYCAYFYNGDEAVGVFFGLNAALVLLYPPAKSLSRISVLMQKCLAATTKVFEMMERVKDTLLSSLALRPQAVLRVSSESVI